MACSYCHDRSACLRASQICRFLLAMDAYGGGRFAAELLSCGHVHISVLGGNAYSVSSGAFGLIERLVRHLK